MLRNRLGGMDNNNNLLASDMDITNISVSHPAPIKNLRSQVIREILSFLDYKDFVNFTMTCQKFNSFLEDPYIQVNLPIKIGSYTLDRGRYAVEEIFVNQYINSKAVPANLNTQNQDLLNIFHRDASNTLYSYYSNIIVSLQLVSWDLHPLRRESWTADFEITKIAACEGVFVIGGRQGLQLISKTNLPQTELDRHQEIYCARHSFRESSKISHLGVLNKGMNVICIINKSEVLVFNNSLQVICNYKTDHEVTAFNVASTKGRNFMIGYSSGGVFIYKTYQSKSKGIEILPHNHDLAGRIWKIRGTRIEKNQRYFDMVLSLTENGRLFINSSDYPQAVIDFEVRDCYLFAINSYTVQMVDLSTFPSLKTQMVFKTGKIRCCLPLNNKLLTIEETGDEYSCALRLYANAELVCKERLGMKHVRSVLHFNDLVVAQGKSLEYYHDAETELTFSTPGVEMTKLIYYYRPIPIWNQT